MDTLKTSITFTVGKSELLPNLKHLLKIIKSGKKKTTLEVTITQGHLDLVIPGVHLNLDAVTDGSAKFSILLWYYADVVQSAKEEALCFRLKENKLTLGSTTFKVQSSFFETDRVLRSISLPQNYSDLDLIRLYLSERYTTEELEFNNLSKDVINSLESLGKDILKVFYLLKKYGFSKDKVEAMILTNLR